MSGIDYWKALDGLPPTPLERLDGAERFNSLAFTTEMAAPRPWLQDPQDWQDVGLVGLERLLWEVYATPVPVNVFEGMVENEDETLMVEMDWEDEVDKMDETGDVDDADAVDDTLIIDAIDEMDVVDEMDGTTFVQMDIVEAMDVVNMGGMDDINIVDMDEGGEMEMVIDS